MTLRGLYGMIDLAPDAAGGEAALALGGALVDGGARIVQLRCKGADARDLLSLARVLAPWCRARAVTFVVNDRLDVALAAGADGVHLGQDDLPLAAARAIAPAGFVIGVSTHDEAQARAAVDGGAGYVAFGPCFTTASKRNPDPVVGLERLARVCAASTIPVVAIGGIDLDTVADVVRAGAAAAAIIRAVNNASDIPAAARQVSAAFQNS
ncbi:MAG TPA: thiamine phosphate synthase [Polyangia bacterium]|jgi:thiamine-phosphate pyrophosphorylase